MHSMPFKLHPWHVSVSHNSSRICMMYNGHVAADLQHLLIGSWHLGDAEVSSHPLRTLANAQRQAKGKQCG